MSASLNGIRVVEYADRSAVLAGRILADLGAEVVLIEPPAGSPARHEGPFLGGAPGLERSYAHLYFNTNKRSVVLDLDDPADRDGFVDLVRTSDVLLETPGPDWFDARGLGPDRLRAENRRLIHCSVTPFGIESPWKHYRGNDLVAGAAGGLIQVSGSPRGTPVQGAAKPSYTMAGLAAASAILVALHQRDQAVGSTGTGVHIDLSVQRATALAVMQTANPSQWQWYGRIPRRPGLSAALECRDGKFVGLLVRPDRFPSFLAWADEVGIDHGMTVEDWRWARLDAPRQNNPVSKTTLALARALTRDAFVAGALQADIVCLPVLDFPDLEREEQFRVNDAFLTLHHPELGVELGFVRSPVDAMADGVSFRRAPLLGEDQQLVAECTTRSRPGAGDPGSPQDGPSAADPAHALSGLRVVDFGWVLAAPIGTRLLASFGAEVIRIESASKPDSMRSQPGPDGKPDPDLGGLFNAVNAGKKSLAVDLKKPAGLALVKALIAVSDVVVNNFRPGALERMGLGFDALRDLKQDIILLNLPGAHRRGPWAARASMGNILMAASGFNTLTGFDGERPRGIGIAYPDFTSPHLLVSTVLAAVRARAETGLGQELHLTQLSGMLSLLGAEWMQFQDTGRQPARNANRDDNYCPHGIYPARAEQDPAVDCWIALAVRNDAQWRRLCGVMARNDLAADPRFVTHADRKRNEDAVDELVADWTRDQEKWLLTAQLQAAGIAAAPVEHLRDMMDVDPQMSRHYQQVSQPVAPDVSIPIDREAAEWVGAPLDLERAPMLGEHNAYVVQDILGYSDDAFAKLIADDVLN